MKNIYYYLIFTVLFLSGTTFAGSIKGKVTNGTAGEKIPKYTVIKLARYVNENEDANFDMKTTADKDGFFYFRNLEADSNIVYQPSVLYKAISYTGKQVVLSKDNSTVISNVTIFEPTKSDSLIYTTLQHFLIIPTDGFLEIQEILLLENKGDRTYTGSIPTESKKFITVNYKLPKDATNIKIGYGLMSCCVEPADEGFYDTMEIKPGKKQISFSYKIKAPDETINFSKEFTIKTKEFYIFLFGDKASLTSSKLKAMPDRVVDNKVIKNFQAVNLKAGDKLKINMAGLAGQPTDWSVITFSGITTILLLAGMLVYFKQKKEKVIKKEDIVEETLDTDDRDIILQRIIQLDEKHEAGMLDETEYLLQRNRLKNKLK